MPWVIVNNFSIVAGLLIQCLSTLELTVQRHVCSILKHENQTPFQQTMGFRAVAQTLRPMRQARHGESVLWHRYFLSAHSRTPRSQLLRFLSVSVTTTI